MAGNASRWRPAETAPIGVVIFQANWTYDMAKQMLLTPELYMQGK